MFNVILINLLMLFLQDYSSIDIDLLISVIMNDEIKVKKLIESGADVNVIFYNSKKFPKKISRFGHDKVFENDWIKCYLENKTLMSFAIINNNEVIFDILIKAQYDFNNKTHSLLLTAVTSNESYKWIKKILENKKRYNIREHEFNSILVFSILNNKWDIVEYIINYSKLYNETLKSKLEDKFINDLDINLKFFNKEKEKTFLLYEIILNKKYNLLENICKKNDMNKNIIYYDLNPTLYGKTFIYFLINPYLIAKVTNDDKIIEIINNCGFK